MKKINMIANIVLLVLCLSVCYSFKSDKVWNIFNQADNVLGDDMIRSRACGVSTFSDIGETTATGYKRSFLSFHGVDYYIEISTDEETRVDISCEFDGNKEKFRTVLLLPNEEIIEIPLDNTVSNIMIPEGTTKIALAGFKAKGTLEISIRPNRNISVKRIK